MQVVLRVLLPFDHLGVGEQQCAFMESHLLAAIEKLGGA